VSSSISVTPTASAAIDSSNRQENSHLLRSLGRLRAPAGFALCALAVYIGWAGREGRSIVADEGIGYVLGIVGGTLMLMLLLYSVRKRIPYLRKMGATRHWFRMHMSLGIVGPLVILYHCNFQVGSINSQVALYCTLLVAASGIVGRYFYAQIHHGLYGSRSSLRQLAKAVEISEVPTRREPGLSREHRTQLANLAAEALRAGTPGAPVLSPMWLGWRTRWIYLQLLAAAYRNIDRKAEVSSVVRQRKTRLRRATRHYLRRRLGEIRRVAQFSLFERLFSLWHIVHVPFFLMMVLSVLVHIVAVHLY
jgi:hypothetical protein